MRVFARVFLVTAHTTFSQSTALIHESAMETLLLLTATQMFRYLTRTNTPTADAELHAHPFLWLLTSPPIGESLPVVAFMERLMTHYIIKRPVKYIPSFSVRTTLSLACAPTILRSSYTHASYKQLTYSASTVVSIESVTTSIPVGVIKAVWAVTSCQNYFAFNFI